VLPITTSALDCHRTEPMSSAGAVTLRGTTRTQELPAVFQGLTGLARLLTCVPTTAHPENRLRIRKVRFAGRSAKRRMNHGNHCEP